MRREARGRPRHRRCRGVNCKFPPILGWARQSMASRTLHTHYSGITPPGGGAPGHRESRDPDGREGDPGRPERSGNAPSKRPEAGGSREVVSKITRKALPAVA